jgi:PAS domain S-box-containing protein
MNNLYLGTVVESSDDAIIGVDLKGIITSWNKGAERIYGYHETEIVGKPATLIVPVDRRNETLGMLEKIERGERIENYETARVTKDGNRIDISLTVSPIRTIEGAIVGASAIGRDITGRKRMVEELRRSETRYRLLFEHMLDGCAHCEMLYDETGHGKDFVYREVNDAFGRLTGLGDVTGKRVSEVVPGILEKHPGFWLFN